ncbi:hypothetical protein [Vibrio parahaemolyticus RIMD 2210633]|uniref:Uncharacterized protein n=1 Tax=Vibrio parahaemolyticus serotype O3:K6 (strain RIMD 2210633) TaxID=223926 RepID=Q87IE1_VIBPA|nr:hypothetical protein [Vibrio parahaemolyticus RIMD 2210633]
MKGPQVIYLRAFLLSKIRFYRIQSSSSVSLRENISTCDSIMPFTCSNCFSESASHAIMRQSPFKLNSAFPAGNVTKPLCSSHVAGTLRAKCRHSVTKYLLACSLSIWVVSLIILSLCLFVEKGPLSRAL